MHKVFNDPIHGHIELEPEEVAVIDTPQFQRLRFLKQMGLSYYVFPGATHNRFEHSIGVCHLAGQWAETLQKKQPELGITKQDIKCVRIAGLCHDLGHGPYSHLFDTHISKKTESGWCHEIASQQMLEHMLQENPEIPLTTQELHFIQDLINGEPRGDYPQARKLYLFEIVANKRNSIDVDKFDYLLRDCHNIGMTCSFDPFRVMKFSRVINNEISFNQKEAYNLYQLFHCRFSLFKQVYTHKVATAIEYMIMDILSHAEKEFQLVKKIHDMKQYTLLDDSIIALIEHSTSKGTEHARKLLQRLRKRDIYRCADAVVVPLELQDHQLVKGICAQAVFVACGTSDIKLEDIVVQHLVLNYAMKDKNPIDSVRFFTKHDNSLSMPLKKEQVSVLIPDHYKEVTIRVFCKESHLTARVQIGFRKLLEAINQTLDEQQTRLEAESSQEHPDPKSLQTLAEQIESRPVMDYTSNPFLTSPGTSSVRNSKLFSPTKRLIVNEALSLTGSPATEKKPSRQPEENPRKRTRKSMPI